MRKYQFIIITLLGIYLPACITSPSQNLNENGEDKFQALEISELPQGLQYFDTTYVAIYSDIYVENKDTRFNLTATLSLRNTS